MERKEKVQIRFELPENKEIYNTGEEVKLFKWEK